MCRNLIASTALLFVACNALFIVGAAQADDTTAAVAQIEKLGGTATLIDGQWEVDFHLRGRELTDDQLAPVAALKNVAWLNLKQTKVTSAGLHHLNSFTNLRSLHLEETEVGDDGVSQLAGLPRLEYLNLYGTNVTDQALDALARCKSLKRLYVWQTDVTDEGVAKLEGELPELRVVRGVYLAKLAAEFPPEEEQPKPKLMLKWVAVSSRGDAPRRSENGINCQVYFENQSARPVRLHWISYGNGELKLYHTLAPGEAKQQNSYSRNSWLVTDESDQPLGYFVCEEDDAMAIIPAES